MSISTVYTGKDTTLDEVLKATRALATEHRDETIPVRELTLEGSNIVSPRGATRLTRAAYKQLATSRLGLKTATFEDLMEGGYHDELRSIMDQRLDAYKEAHPSDSWFLRHVTGEAPRVRAVLTDSFKPMDGDLVVPLVMRALEAMPSMRDATVQEFRADHAGLSIQLRTPQLDLPWEKDPHFGAVGLTTSDLGRGSLEFYLRLLQQWCTNGATTQIAGRSTRIVHLGGGGDTARILTGVQRAISDTTTKGTHWVFRYAGLKEVPLQNPKGVLTEVASRVEIGKRAAEYMVENVLPIYMDRTGSNALAVVQTVTQYARDLKPVAKRVEMEARAGRIVDLPESHWAVLDTLRTSSN